jgi:hypothetical protein
MVPPESFSTAAPSLPAPFCSGCEAGTQCEIFSSKFFSCAIAGVTPAAKQQRQQRFSHGHSLPWHDRPFDARPHYLTCYLARPLFQGGHPVAPFLQCGELALHGFCANVLCQDCYMI